MRVNKAFHDMWLAGGTATSKSDATLENSC